LIWILDTDSTLDADSNASSRVAMGFGFASGFVYVRAVFYYNRQKNLQDKH